MVTLTDSRDRLRLSAEREHSNWGPLRRFIDALLRRVRGRGLRTFTDKQRD